MPSLSRPTSVSFQGEIGAYSESAVYRFFGSDTKAVPCKWFSDVFRSVDSNETDFGIVPIENSLEGSVTPVYDLFLDSSLKVRGEIILKIVHCLIANPKVELDSVKVVYSHPQALGQCRAFLENFGREIISTYDTAGSVKMIKEKTMLDASAVASERAAEVYKMKILAKNIADNPNNYTRFFILSKDDVQPTGEDKTSIIFSTKHAPGALWKVLGELAKRSINLTKIESRPKKSTPWEYNFYVDFEGHRTETHCAEALKALGTSTSFMKILGSYPKASKRAR